MKAQFITIEGGEGVGKSTNIALVRSILEKHNISYVVSREPGGTPLAEELREILLRKRTEVVHPETELLLMFAARAQHVNQFIRPALNKGDWVICDRFTDATFAYQGGGRGLDWDKIEALEKWTLGDFKPDKTILLDVAPEIGLARASARAELDRFESEKMSFFEKVRSAYLKRRTQDPERFLVVDAGKSLEDVQTELANQLEAYLLQVLHG